MANTQTAVPLFVANAVLTAAQQNISAGTGVPVFATTVTRDAAFGGSNKALAEGQLCYIEASNIVQYYDGAAWATVGPSAPAMAVFNETQANGTNGGTATAGAWTKRTLNTTLTNGITGCSLASSVITLPAGTYYTWQTAPMYNVDRCPVRLQNTTDASTAAFAQNAYAASANAAWSASNAMGFFTITGNKNFEIQYYAETTRATNGLGVAMSFGTSEIYSQISIMKVA